MTVATRLLLFLCLLGTALPALAAEGTALENRIVRALTLDSSDPYRLLAGIKGKAAGSGLVFESRDGGRTWTALNGGRPLAAAATDVQAVAYGPDGRVLAGTWKHGLFLSRDGGARFEKHASFPGRDIRDLKAVPDDPSILYAATGRDGLFKSEDGGARWRSLGRTGTFFWSLTLSPSGDAVYAVSLENKVLRSRDGGVSWETLFERENAYALAIAPGDARSLALATEAGLYLSTDGGGSWRLSPALPDGKLSSLAWPAAERLYVGAWDGGVRLVNPAGRDARPLLPALPVVHLALSRGVLLVGTWGRGLRQVDVTDSERQ